MAAGFGVLGLVVLAAGWAGGEEARADTLPEPGSAWVIFGSDTVRAETAVTPAQRERGLSGRAALAEGEAMLFVYPDQAPRTFWMRGTPFALDVAFLDSDGTIFEIRTLEALSETPVTSRGPARHVLEVPAGWFRRRGIAEGSVGRIVLGPPEEGPG